MSAAPAPRRSPVGAHQPSAPLALLAHPSAELYGSDRVLLESISALREDGFRVVVVLPSDGPLTAAALERGASVIVTPSLVLRKSLLRPRGLLRLLTAGPVLVLRHRALLRRLRPEVVVVNTVTVPGWLIASRLASIPAVCHVHEAERSASSLVRRGLNAPLVLARRVIANSVFSRDTLLDATPRLAARSVVVYNGVEGPRTATAPRSALDTAPLRLAFLGRISERKGAAVAVESLIELRRHGVDARLTLIGDVFPGYEWFRDRLRQRIAESGVGDHVVEAGFVDPVWPLLDDADIVLIPSVADEPFGNTAVEAVLAARPTVVSDTSGLREAGAVFDSVVSVPPGDARALAEAVVRIVEDWPAARERARRSAVDAAERYGVPRYRERFAAEVRAAVPDLAHPRAASDHGRNASPTTT
ncbi:glycosyltransferase family 4 protein [Mycetocola reblochoni]|uniref:Glycosyl transferase, group 1 n=2 Tax=Mycetocola reblochoni TaxID=331618 RepID=A0A1R4I882_9MICO|nr:glycosyltransferase family 4 protein [Mycetocola reblochoni]RLP68951.1 glycosyltransferase [Mycetocola reblochoni]SJN16037.1 Glycosyl transferase, group 1 [Mycetocola reblochoni REB411]